MFVSSSAGWHSRVIRDIHSVFCCWPEHSAIERWTDELYGSLLWWAISAEVSSWQMSGVKMYCDSTVCRHLAQLREGWAHHFTCTWLLKQKSGNNTLLLQWGHIRHCSTRRMSVSPNQTHQHIIMIEKENKTYIQNIISYVYIVCIKYLHFVLLRSSVTNSISINAMCGWSEQIIYLHCTVLSDFYRFFFLIHCRNNIVLQSVSKELMQNKIQQ